MNNNLILLLAGLVCAHAAPQFVFVLPPEFLQQMQKPVGDAAQLGQQPPIQAIPLESLLGSPSTVVESIVSAPVVPKSLQDVASPIVEVEQQQTAESSPVAVTELPPVDPVAEIALALAKAQTKVTVTEAPIEQTIPVEASPAAELAPIVEILVEEAVPVAQEIPVEEVIVEEVITEIQETTVDIPVQELAPKPVIALQKATPVEEIITPSTLDSIAENAVAVEEVVIVQDANTNTAEEIIVVEEVIPSSDAVTTQSPVTVSTSTTVPTSSMASVTSAPVSQVVDPRMSVDPRFRNYIYVNDAPDVVAAKVALFNLQAASLPKQQVI